MTSKEGVGRQIVKLILWCLFLGGSHWAVAASSPSLRFNVTEKILQNGLTVIVHEDHSVPMVSYHTWFRVGSKDEDVGFTGIAHLFEHMMFKGAKRYSGKDFDRILQANGATHNAFTTYDYTGYFEDMPSHKLELIMDVESDRMESLALTAANLQSEREVVKEERRMRVDNSPDGILNETLWSKAFEKHPYHWPVIGWMTDINAITLERCQKFFKMFYNVSNAVIVVAGDVDTTEVMKLVQKYYGHLQKVPVAKMKKVVEPPQERERYHTIKKNLQTEKMALAYKIGRQGEYDSFVMDIIASILSEGESSRLFKRLVQREQLVTQVEGFAFTPQDPGLYEIFVEMKPSISGERVLKIMTEEIEQLGKVKPTDMEVQTAKNKMTKTWITGVRTIHGKARLLALNEIVTGTYESLFSDLEKYDRVTADDVMRVARTYLIKNHRTVVRMIPSKLGDK